MRKCSLHEADWLIVYADGRAITSLEATPDRVPRSGVVCIVQREGLAGSAFSFK